jgi:broad specificity phosphatase PhoE
MNEALNPGGPAPMAFHLYVSHPEVLIDPAVPVPRWGLNARGRERMAAFAVQPWLRRFGRVVSSDETKAIETAEAIAAALDMKTEVRRGLHENDRSATGFLPPPEFEATANLFFAHPQESIRGWERSIDAQSRIVAGIADALAERPETPTIFCGHGGVGTLLWCYCARTPIQRSNDQRGGGNHYLFDLAGRIVLYGWRPLEAAPEPTP